MTRCKFSLVKSQGKPSRENFGNLSTRSFTKDLTKKLPGTLCILECHHLERCSLLGYFYALSTHTESDKARNINNKR